MQIHGVGVMRKALGRSRGANKRAGRIGLLVACEWWEQDFERRLEAESLVWGQEERTTPAGGEAHRQRGLGFVVSCGSPGQKGSRTELELCGPSADSSPTMRNSPEKVFTEEEQPFTTLTASIPGRWRSNE
jgi:hypothetical protein